MERPLANILRNGGLQQTPTFGCLFILSSESVEKTDFEKLIMSLLNDTENSLSYNYTVKGQN